MAHIDDDEWTEVTDARIPRMDLVGKSANGTRFLLMKDQEQAGLMSPALVRSLIGEATPTPTPTAPVTNIAALLKTIHEAAVRDAETASTHPQETAMADPITKDVDLDASQIPAADTESAPGEESMPGSAAWEALDAATAGKWTAILGRAKAALEWLAGREQIEGASGDGSDYDNAWSLEDASCAIDYAISVLAPYAAGEQLEVDTAEDDLSVLGKALAGADVDSPLAVIEGLAPVVKAGRVLSAANEAAIRGAAEALQKVLATLPAPEATEEAPVTKTDTEQTPADTAEVTKAKGDPQVAVYDANGRLVGTIDQKDLNPIAEAAAPAKADDTDTPADEAPAEDAPAELVQPDANDGPAADAAAPVAPQTPAAPTADDVQKAREDQIELLKSTISDAVEAAVAPLRERLEKVEAQPMPGGPALNGVIPGATPMILRGQDSGTPDALRKAFEDEQNPIRKQELQFELAAQMVRSAPRL